MHTQVPGTYPLGCDQLLTVAGPGGDLGQVSLLYRKDHCKAAGAKQREPHRLQQVTGSHSQGNTQWDLGAQSHQEGVKGTMRSEAEGDMAQAQTVRS